MKKVNKQTCLFIFLIFAIIILSVKTSFSQNKTSNVIFVVYQGALEDTPENTMVAFKRAVEMGARGLMVDIRLTKDKQIVLMHDETIDRTTDGKGRVDQMLYDELRLYDAGSWRGDEFAGERVPHLSDVLQFCKINGLKLVLDVKEFGMERLVISIVKEHDMISDVYFLGTLKNIRKLEPGLPIHNIIFKMPKEIDSTMIQFAHAERNHTAVKMLNSDSRSFFKKCISKKADIIVLNYPQLISTVVKYEKNKVIYPEPVHYIDLQKKKDKSLINEPGSLSKPKNVVLQKNTMYIRDELSTLVSIMQGKDTKKDDARMAALAIAGSLDESSVQILISLLKNKKAVVRLNAAWALGIKSDKKALNALINLIKDKNEEVMRESILALKRIARSNQLSIEESSLISQKLVKVLKDDSDANVRYDAARTLGDIKSKDSINQLSISLRDDPDWNVKSACAGALGKIGDKRGVRPLEDILVTDAKIDSVWTRRRAAWALAEIGEDAIENLISAFSDNEKSTRLRASWALIKIGKPAVQSLVLPLKSMDKFVKERAALSLGWIGDDYAVKALNWALKDIDPDVRIASAWALGRIGSPIALNALEIARKDKNFSVRRSVVEAINIITDQNKL